MALTQPEIDAMLDLDAKSKAARNKIINVESVLGAAMLGVKQFPNQITSLGELADIFGASFGTAHSAYVDAHNEYLAARAAVIALLP